MLRIKLSQLNLHTGNFELNTNKIIDSIESAKHQSCDLVVFSELTVCGYPPRDFLEFDEFIDRCLESVQTIASHCSDGIAAIVGSPSINTGKGKHLFNSAYFLQQGKVHKLVHKTLLPNYDVFDEYRYFEPNRTFEIIEYKQHRIALTVCEDIWNTDAHPLYVQNPMDELSKQHPDFIINIAASPFSVVQHETRLQVLRENAEKYQLPVFYVNHIGAQEQLIFDGGSCVINSDGKLHNVLHYFREDEKYVDILKKEILSTPTPHPALVFQDKYEKIEQALILGIREYFKKQGFQKAILGLSGGIDSALVLYLAVQALGPENVLAVMMPSHFSSEHSITDSEALASQLGVKTETISIESAYQTFTHLLQPIFQNTPLGIAEENIQSRSRALILMAIANKMGYVLLNTSNKSELSVGYGTLYGDMCGGISVIGDVYKTEVYDLCRYINRYKEIIPRNIILKEPSAELRPNQKDSDSLPPYSLLDAVLFKYIEEHQTTQEIIQNGFDADLVKRIISMVNSNEWKRYQAPPVLRISVKSFGPGRRMPIVARYLSQ